jgi:excisionase family DNA binding protein
MITMISEQMTLQLLETLSAKLDAIAAKLQAQPSPEYYSIKQAARVVGVSCDHIRRAVVGGMLACSNVGTMSRATYRISRVDLLAWLERQKAGPISPARKRSRTIPLSRHHQKHGKRRSDEPGS